jgi:Protein of unknown function (DUF559)
LIVEVDGGQHNRSSPREAERSGFLQNQGYRILRFWNNEVLANLDGVHQTIAHELGNITPPDPPLSRGRAFAQQQLEGSDPMATVRTAPSPSPLQWGERVEKGWRG